MKKQEKIISQKKSVNIKTQISNAVRSELPKLHSKLFKNFNGKINFINNFIYVPDLILGGDFDAIKKLNQNTAAVSKYLSTGPIDYDLIGFSLDKKMLLKFQYIFQDKDSGLSSVVWLREIPEGWEVYKIEAYA